MATCTTPEKTNTALLRAEMKKRIKEFGISVDGCGFAVRHNEGVSFIHGLSITESELLYEILDPAHQC